MASDVAWGCMQVRRTPKKRQLINSHFKTIYGHFFANYMFIFHKTEIQTVILRCLTIINLNCYKSYDTKHKKAKNAKTQIHVFVQNCKINRNGNICVLRHNFWTNQNVDLLSTSKWPLEPQFCERWTYIMAFPVVEFSRERYKIRKVYG